MKEWKERFLVFLLSAFVIWGTVEISTKTANAATVPNDVLLNGEITLYDGFNANGTTHKEWYVSDASRLNIVRTGNNGRYCVVKGVGLGDATVTCVTTYTVKVASAYGFTLETRYNRTVQNVRVVSTMPWKYIYADPDYYTLPEVSVKESESKYVILTNGSYLNTGVKTWSNTDENVAKAASEGNSKTASHWEIQGISEGTAILTCESVVTITDNSAKKKWINRTFYTIPVTVLKNDALTENGGKKETVSSGNARQKPSWKKAGKKVKKIKLNTYKKKLKRKKKYKLKVKVLPAVAKKNGLIFKSSRPSVASVNKKGVIKARKKGTAKIKVKVRGSKKKAVCKVIVK